jgi:hypothetical protein
VDVQQPNLAGHVSEPSGITDSKAKKIGFENGFTTGFTSIQCNDDV